MFMSGFDKHRFAEAFAAAVLGAAAHEYLRGGASKGADDFDVVRKFQRALLVATAMPGFTEDVSVRYIQRLAGLPKAGKKRYLRQVLQPSDTSFDERMTSIVIFDHALQPEGEWQATSSLYQADQQGFDEQLIAAPQKLADWIGDQAEKAELDRQDREKNGSFWTRVGARIDKYL